MFSYGVRRSAAPCSSRAQKRKNPTEINPVGFLVLATSYSRTAYRRTTIGAAAFHCRVRNGNGWGHCAIVTRAEKRLRCPALVRDSKFVTSVLPIDDSPFTISFKERQFAGIYIQEFISAETADATTLELRFVLRSFVSSVCHPAC